MKNNLYKQFGSSLSSEGRSAMSDATKAAGYGAMGGLALSRALKTNPTKSALLVGGLSCLFGAYKAYKRRR
jgi:uncharacterized membrane protein YebE (DUF533 family)